MNTATFITFSWITKRGAHAVERINWADLEARTKLAFERRVKAEAWLGDSREDIVAQVFKRDGQWLWWSESPDPTPTSTPEIEAL